MDITSTVVREKSTQNNECVAPLSYFYIVLLLRGQYAKTSTQPIEHTNTQHGTIYPKTQIDQHIIVSSSMETLAGVHPIVKKRLGGCTDRHPSLPAVYKNICNDS
jgi:hypothetical protein